MNALLIIQRYLEQNGYDGLYDAGECSCKLGDLAPCDSDFSDCAAGVLYPCECGGNCGFHIGPRLEAAQ